MNPHPCRYCPGGTWHTYWGDHYAKPRLWTLALVAILDDGSAQEIGIHVQPDESWVYSCNMQGFNDSDIHAMVRQESVSWDPEVRKIARKALELCAFVDLRCGACPPNARLYADGR